jgi:hypothetical protein
VGQEGDLVALGDEGPHQDIQDSFNASIEAGWHRDFCVDREQNPQMLIR